MAFALSSIDVGVMLQKAVVNFQSIRQGVPRCLTLSSHTVAVNYTRLGQRRLYTIALLLC